MQFDSPIGNKKFAGAPLRELDVPDESDHPHVASKMDEEIQNMRMQREHEAMAQKIQERDTSEVEREIRAAREAKRTGKERLNDGAKRRIEMLIGMTRSTREANIDGNVYIFQTLKAKEMREAILAASEFDGTVQSPFEIRRQFLARSITHIAGVEFELFIGANDLETKLLFIEELDDALLNRLYDEYVLLSRDARDKYSIKTVDEAKGVTEDLKKS
jgi:hypothetical protein